MIRRPPRSTRTDTLLPYTTLFRSDRAARDATRDDAFVNREMELTPEIVGRISPYHSESGLDRKKHTSELQSLMRISYAVFCLKKKKPHKKTSNKSNHNNKLNPVHHHNRT